MWIGSFHKPKVGIRILNGIERPGCLERSSKLKLAAWKGRQESSISGPTKKIRGGRRRSAPVPGILPLTKIQTNKTPSFFILIFSGSVLVRWPMCKVTRRRWVCFDEFRLFHQQVTGPEWSKRHVSVEATFAYLCLFTLLTRISFSNTQRLPQRRTGFMLHESASYDSHVQWQQNRFSREQ